MSNEEHIHFETPEQFEQYAKEHGNFLNSSEGIRTANGTAVTLGFSLADAILYERKKRCDE